MNAGALIEEVFQKHKDQVFWSEKDFQRSYAQVKADLEVVSALLRPQGVRGGVWAAHGLRPYQQFLLALDAMQHAWVFAPLSSRYRFDQLSPWLEQVPLQGYWQGLEGDDQDPQRVFVESLRHVPQLTEPSVKDEVPDESALVLFSSGSTGRPKAIVHGVQSLSVSARETLRFYGAETGDCWLLSLDISHIGGFQILWRCFLGGLTVVAAYAPHQIEAALLEQTLHFLSLVPTQVSRLLEHENIEERMRSVKAVLLGGAASSASLLRTLEARAWPVSVTYGATEAASQVSAFPAGVYPKQEGEVGELLAHWEAELRGERLLLKGPSACLGWWQERQFIRPEAGAQTWCSPDRACMSRRSLQILGRADQVFQVAGENLDPREVLVPLAELSRAGDWVLLAQADEVYGKIPILIFRGPQPPPSRELLEDIWQKTLPRLKYPRACYWHKSEDQLKPSQSYYESALRDGLLECVWTRS